MTTDSVATLPAPPWNALFAFPRGALLKPYGAKAVFENWLWDCLGYDKPDGFELFSVKRSKVR